MPKVSDGRYIHVGLVGPKPRRKRVGDGQTVDIPLPLADDQVLRWGRGEVGPSSCWSDGDQARRSASSEAWGRPRYVKANRVDPHFPEKPAEGSRERPYRRPTQVGGCESTKVDG